MLSELASVVVVLLFAAAAVALALRVHRLRWGRLATIAAAAWGAASLALIGAAIANREPPRPPPPDDLPLQVADEEYRSSAACRSCHPHEFATWRGSYHRTMTQRATPAAVIGDFDDAEVEFEGVRYAMFRKDGGFWGRIDSRLPDGRMERHVVELEQTTGFHHMQIYWYAAGRARTVVGFPIVYLREQQRWVPRKAAFLTPPEPALMDMGNWNGICIECHTTRPQPRVRDSRRRISDSHVAELGIACEACHGPGGAHVDANRSPARRYRLHLSDVHDDTIVNPDDLPHVRSTQVCGQCHVVKTAFDEDHFARWLAQGSGFRPGQDLDEVVQVVSNQHRHQEGVRSLLDEQPDFHRSTFWEGGIVRVSGREYNGLLETPCFQRGEMSCLSCHRLHQAQDDPRERSAWANDQLAPGMETNRACLQCHERFAGDEALARHSRHPAGSSGSECMNCHMPHTTYGLLKAIRSHTVDSPSVAVDLETGRPNACNLCHLDRPLAWTAEHLQRWYDVPVPELGDDARRVAAGVRWALEGDAGVRALAAWSMGWPPAREASGTSWLVPYLAELMNDPYDAVRMIATRSLAATPGLEATGFDPLAEPEARAVATRRIRDRWEGSPAAHADPRGRGDRTLFDEYGRLQTAEVARLLEQRDVRPLTLAE